MIQQYICENKMLIRLLWPVIYMRSNTKRGFKLAVALVYSLIRFFPLQKYSSTISFRPSWHNNCSEKAELNSGQLKHGLLNNRPLGFDEG